ncbi:MAG: hypothetical protein ACLP4R_16075 [Solirubrobacteraceae bacterium]
MIWKRAVVGGVKHSAGNLVNLGPSELGLFQSDAADPTTSILSTTLIPELDRTPGIAAATPLILLVGDLPKAPGAIVFGADRDGFLTGGLVFSSGRPFGVLSASSAASTPLGAPPTCRPPASSRNTDLVG